MLEHWKSFCLSFFCRSLSINPRVCRSSLRHALVYIVYCCLFESVILLFMLLVSSPSEPPTALQGTHKEGSTSLYVYLSVEKEGRDGRYYYSTRSDSGERRSWRHSQASPLARKMTISVHKGIGLTQRLSYGILEIQEESFEQYTPNCS